MTRAATARPQTRVRLRLLPWSLRRRVRGWRHGDVLGEVASEGGSDDPFSAAVALVLLALFAVLVLVPFVLGLALLPFELLALALVAGGALLLQVVGVRPWTVAVEQRVDGRWTAVGRVQRRGLAAARAERDALRAEAAADGAVVALARRGVAGPTSVPDPGDAADGSAGALPPAGWYADPGASGGLRLWDGAAWTDRTAPAGAAPQDGSWYAAPPRRRGRTAVAVAGVAAVLAGAVLGGLLVVRGLGGMIRTGGHPEMAAELERTGLGDAFEGQGVVLDGNRLGIDSPARVVETLEAPRGVPYDRIGALLADAGWSPAPCAAPRDPAERCWSKPSPERRATAYELAVLPGEPGPLGVAFDVEVTELPPAQAGG